MRIIGGATPLDLDIARQYIRQMITAIHYMHQCNIIHRDLKPQNVLLSRDKENIKICDFGTACFLSDVESLTVPKGTPAFMAPEILMKPSLRGPSQRRIATLFMMTTGRQPFEAAGYRALVNKVRNDELVFPRDVKLDPHLKNLIIRMLSKEVSRRPSLNDICNHDWITDEGTQPLLLDESSILTGEDWDEVFDEVEELSSNDDEEADKVEEDKSTLQ